MDETEEKLNEGALLPNRAKKRLGALGPALFAVLAIVCSLGAFVTGGYLSLGPEGIKKIVEARKDGREDPAFKPTHEWITLEKTIYQLERREDAQYVLAEFTIRVPITRAEEVRKRIPELEFALQTYIRELSSRELQGAMGLYNLRNACLFRARRILGRDAIDDILVGELLVE